MEAVRSQAGPDLTTAALQDGVTLRMLLQRSPLSTEQAVAVGIGVLSGLRELQRAGSGHGSLDTSSVLLSAGGQARLTGASQAPFEPRADVKAAGLVICAALRVAPRPVAGRPAGTVERSRPRLVAAARTIANGGAGRSAATALMIFGDAAGRIDSEWRIERTMAGLERLAVPPSSAIATAVDGIMKPLVQPRRPQSIRVPQRALPLAMLGAAVLALLVLSSLPVLHPTSNLRPASTAAAGPAAPAPVLPATAPPDAVVTQFYKLAAAHKFDQGLALWDEKLRTTLPPAQYPDQRFAQTTALTVNRATVTSQDTAVATVATDLTEVTGGVQHHWVGSWRLVKTSGVWLLDQPDFRPA